MGIGDQLVAYFGERDVGFAPNEAQKIIGMGFDPAGTTIPSHRIRRDLAFGVKARHPAHGAGDADPETLGRLVARKAAFHHRIHNPFTKIVRKRHLRRLLLAAEALNHNKSDRGIPPRFTLLRYRSSEGFGVPAAW